MTLLHSFEEKLTRAFHGRLRIRWSVKNRTWQVEQKVGRASLPPIKIEEDRDDLICARDGYAYVMSISQGDRMCCPECKWRELRVPVREFADIRCDFCASLGKQGRVVAGYFPLDDSLIDHLKKIDPDGTHSRNITKEIDQRNQAREMSTERDMSNIVESAGNDYYDQLVGIPHFAYSHSNTKCWPAELGPTKD